MKDHHRYSDQDLWSFLKQTPNHPVYQAYYHQLFPARVVSGMTLVLLATSIGLFGLHQVVWASGLIISSFVLSVGFGSWLLLKRPSPHPVQSCQRPSPTQWRIIALFFALGFATLIGLTVLTMVYRDQIVYAIRQGQVNLVLPPTN